MEFSLAANPDDYWTAFEAGWYQAMFGDRQQAVTLFTDNYVLLDDVDKYTMPLCSPAIEVVWAEQYIGSSKMGPSSLAKCTRMFEAELSANKKNWGLYYLGARIYALKGDSEQSIEYLQKAVDNGWREWWTKNDPLLSSINENPKYKEIIAFIDTDLAKQAKEVRALFQ
jgi:tetratricopeptide (TPR) repeat protein